MTLCIKAKRTSYSCPRNLGTKKTQYTKWRKIIRTARDRDGENNKRYNQCYIRQLKLKPKRKQTYFR